MRKLFFFLLAAVISTACTRQVSNPQTVGKWPDIYPDYTDVTIPAGIAPLDFAMADDNAECIDVVVKGDRGGELHANGRYADFSIDEWHELTQQNKGHDLWVSVCAYNNGQWTQYKDFPIHVSTMALDDYGLTYRLIKPGYEVGGDIGIYQRNIHTFEQQPLLTETLLPGKCMNCHIPNQTDPSAITLQIRGEGGGTLIQKDGVQQWLDTRTDSTKAACSYASWHPSARYCIFATNSVHQSFYVGTGQRIEVFHLFSNLVMLDTNTHELILSPLLQTDDLEIFPAFSADGKTVYYSTSKPCRMPAEYEKVKCSLCAISFDESTAQFGTQADTLINAAETGKSCVLAKPSYDGRWLMYVVADCGNFPVCRPEADLWLMDLKTRETWPLDILNSHNTESWHCWSTNSRWVVFASKREDGMYTQLFFTSIDDQGKATKPFLLPQRNPKVFYREMMDAYNVPEFTKVKASIGTRQAYRQVTEGKRINVKIR